MYTCTEYMSEALVSRCEFVAQCFRLKKNPKKMYLKYMSEPLESGCEFVAQCLRRALRDYAALFSVTVKHATVQHAVEELRHYHEAILRLNTRREKKRDKRRRVIST